MVARFRVLVVVLAAAPLGLTLSPNCSDMAKRLAGYIGNGCMLGQTRSIDPAYLTYRLQLRGQDHSFRFRTNDSKQYRRALPEELRLQSIMRLVPVQSLPYLEVTTGVFNYTHGRAHNSCYSSDSEDCNLAVTYRILACIQVSYTTCRMLLAAFALCRRQMRESLNKQSARLTRSTSTWLQALSSIVVCRPTA